MYDMLGQLYGLSHPLKDAKLGQGQRALKVVIVQHINSLISLQSCSSWLASQQWPFLGNAQILLFYIVLLNFSH